jgi:pyrroline-5-carboxylate reductase
MAEQFESTDSPRELVFIGGGNMGAALIGGLLAAGTAAETLGVVELSPERRDWLRAEFPGVEVTDKVPACHGAVLAVKPPQIAAVAVAAVRAGARRLLSIAAGISTTTIDAAIDVAIDVVRDAATDVVTEADFGDHDVSVAVIRAMPNTPALVGQGVAAITGGRHATEADLGWAEQILMGVGSCVRISEDLFDAVTAVTGSGPAYVFLFAEALTAAACAAGIEAEMADRMVRQLLSGSAELLAQRGDPVGLRAMVTSPGGTTAAGIAALEAHGFNAAIEAAVEAAAQRSRELG